MTRITRRAFLGASGLIGSALLLPRRAGAQPWRRPGRGRDRLRLGVIGVGNRGRDNLLALAKEEVDIVALCDVDRRYLEAAAKEIGGGARLFADFREMFAAHGSLDAAVVSTADHTHAPAAAMALRAGLDVYCEKPLAHTVREARILTDLAARRGAVTQLGTQIHSWPNYRRVVELVRSGAIGEVREVHVFCDKTWSGGERPSETPAEPKWLDWDLWLGPAPERPYHKAYHPAGWRRWWDFGNGTLGDMACHYMDLAFWALDLRYPSAVQARKGPIHAETTPRDMVVRYEFPARGEAPPVELTWYDDRARPPKLADPELEKWRNGVLFVGAKGQVIADYSEHAILPAERFADFTPPKPWIPDSIGHHKEWVEACRQREKTSCAFSYSGPLSEAVLLGNVSYRLGGVRLEWDAERLAVTNEPRAGRLLRRRYRPGWKL